MKKAFKCPECGSKNVYVQGIWVRQNNFNDEIYYQCICKHCGHRGPKAYVSRECVNNKEWRFTYTSPIDGKKNVRCDEHPVSDEDIFGLFVNEAKEGIKNLWMER